MLLMGQDLAAVLTKWVVAFYVACMDIRLEYLYNIKGAKRKTLTCN